MASGSSGRGSDPGSKAFDFGSDDILCSYEDFGNQDGNNGNHSDHSVTTNSAKEFHKSRMSRSSVYPAANYSPPEESTYHQNVVSTVENTMKKHTDNIMRFLEGLSSRLSQLELYCYNVDKSIGEMRSDLVRDHGDSESKLKSLEKHMQEVHRSVQILRDKQELADTQKELAKLQLAQKESSATNNTQKSEEKVAPPSSGPMMNENASDAPEQRLALALPHQLTQPPRPLEHQQPVMPPPPSSIPLQIMPHVQAYYVTPSQMTNVNAPSRVQQSQPQYLTPSQPQIQDNSRIAPPPVQSQVNQSPPVQQVPAYQQQWAQQQQPAVQQPQPPVMQQQIRNPSPQMAYSTYIPGHPSQSSQEMAPNSMPMQGTFLGSSLPAPTGSESMPYGYGSSNRPIQPQPPTPNLKISGYGPQHPGEGYVPSGPRQAPAPGGGYIVYDNEGGRQPHHLPPTNPQLHYQQNAYPPTSMPQRMPSPNMVVPPQPVRSHPYNELIEKLVSMGYRGDHVVGVIQRLEESGQPVDFNSVLDRLNGHGGGGSSQRGWSG